MPTDRPADLPRVGWREWVSFPGLPLPPVKAKVDTGARTSALHAFDVRHETREDGEVAIFDVHPHQRDDETVVRVEAPVVDLREVTSSNGEVEERLVVRIDVALGTHELPIEVTLTNRDSMGFRMLLGRTALAGRFLVDPARSYQQSAPPQPPATPATTPKAPRP